MYKSCYSLAVLYISQGSSDVWDPQESKTEAICWSGFPFLFQFPLAPSFVIKQIYNALRLYAELRCHEDITKRRGKIPGKGNIFKDRKLVYLENWVWKKHQAYWLRGRKWSGNSLRPHGPYCKHQNYHQLMGRGRRSHHYLLRRRMIKLGLLYRNKTAQSLKQEVYQLLHPWNYEIFSTVVTTDSN